MTIPELIHRVLGYIYLQFYSGALREFKRDERALTRAIARYGYACHQRGWEFQAEAIARDLFDLLRQIRQTDADWDYFPIYLEGAVDRHIGQRAEELSAAAKSTPRAVAKLVSGLRTVEAVHQPGVVETLDMLYRELRARQRAKPRGKKGKQLNLL